MKDPKLFFVMGVSGSGKSTIGKQIAVALDIPFYDGDDYHPASNIKKMSEGNSLTDADRKGWLERLNTLAKNNEHTGAIIVCSALKNSYRTILKQQLQHYKFVYLKGSFTLIDGRLKSRENHFMPANLLQSQFDILEEPEDAITVSIDQSIERITKEVLTKVGTL